MPKIVFISYSHKQGEWVWKNLKPCLDAGGAEVRIDIERFRAGKEVIAQMDAEQEASDLSVLVLSPEYLASTMCQHEMRRAIACKKFVGVLRVDCAAPDEVTKTVYVDLRDDKAAGEWEYLSAFRSRETQPLPGNEAIYVSLRRRLLMEEESGHWRLRVPLMVRW